MKKIFSIILAVFVIAQPCFAISLSNTDEKDLHLDKTVESAVQDELSVRPDPEIESVPDLEESSTPVFSTGTSADTETEVTTEQENDSSSSDETTEIEEDTPAQFTRMELSSFGVEMIKSFEGFYSKAYWDYSQWTIGYGSRCEENEYPNGITEYEATLLLKKEMPTYVNAVNNLAQKYNIILTQNQFDALVSFTYNTGTQWTYSSTIRTLLISGNYTEQEMTNAFLLWIKAGDKILDGLVKRRTREAALFNSDMDITKEALGYYYVTASTLYVRPTPSTLYEPLGSVSRTIVVPVTEFSSDGNWAYTPYAAFFGWISTDYIRPVGSVPVLDDNMMDSQGVKYSLGTSYKTISVGVIGASNKGNALYEGFGDGNVYLNSYIKWGDYVYYLTEIVPGAFYGNKSLKTIYIPDSVKSIAHDSFTNSSLETIYCSEGSYAAEYADKHGYGRLDYACRNGHTYSSTSWTVIREVTCTLDGLEGKCCDVCGSVGETRVYKSAIGHAYIEGKWQTITALSCTDDHIEGILCENCKETRETRIVASATGHSYTDGAWEIVMEENCIANGLKAVICTVCEAHIKEEIIPATGHTPGDWETVSTVSCTTDGVRVKKCTVCGDDAEKEVTPAYHVYDENNWQVVKEPKCTELGEKAVICTVCGDKVMTDTIAAKGHSFGDWYVKTQPTYTKKGVYRRDCDGCTDYETKSIDKLEIKIITQKLALDSQSKTVQGILVKTKVLDVLALIENSADVKIIDTNGKKVSDDSYVGTGMKLVLFEGNTNLLSYTFIISGDADGNGLATDWDCILLGRYLAGWNVTLYTEALDFDKNGKVNDWDEILFSRYLAGWKVDI